MPTSISSESQFQSFVDKDSLTVVDFYADWCGPCKAIAPEYEKLSLLHPQVSFLKVNVDSLASISSKYSVHAMPTFLFFRKGSVIDKVVGADINKVKQLVSLHASSSFSSGGRVLGTGKPAGSSDKDASQYFFLFLGLFIVYLWWNQ